MKMAMHTMEHGTFYCYVTVTVAIRTIAQMALS